MVDNADTKPKNLSGCHPLRFVRGVSPWVRPRAFFYVAARMKRVIAFIDGFNLYHAINDLGQAHLKWLNLNAMCTDMLPRDGHLEHVYYFSAYATWLTNPYRRHREYVKALTAVGVEPVMGQFKKKLRQCKVCHATYPFHEEKQSDVNLAIYLLKAAILDEFDLAMVISNDSDMVPAIKMVRSLFPDKEVWSVCPPGRQHTMELVHAVRGPTCLCR